MILGFLYLATVLGLFGLGFYEFTRFTDGYGGLRFFGGALAVFSLFIYVLGHAHILTWWSTLLTAALFVAAGMWWSTRQGHEVTAEFSVSRETLVVCGVLFLIVLTQYVTLLAGSYQYPWLEDTDPYQHATSTRYVAEHATFWQSGDEVNLHYLPPYPPLYDGVMAVVYEAGLSPLTDVLKHVNVFLVAYALLLAFFFFRELLGRRPGLISTAALLSIPGFMSHFIWSQTIAIALSFPALLSFYIYLEKQSKEWFWIAVLFIVMALTAQPSNTGIIGVSLGLIAMTYGVRNVDWSFSFENNRFLFKTAGLLALSVVASWALLWGVNFAVFGFSSAMEGLGLTKTDMFIGGSQADTSSGEPYGLSDFLFPESQGKIDQQKGIGWFFVVLAMLGVGFSWLWRDERRRFIAASMGVLGLFYLALVQGDAMPYKLFPHRMWVYLAIPVAYFAGTGAWGVWTTTKQLIGEGQSGFLRSVTAIILALCFVYLSFATAFQYKYDVQTSRWPDHVIPDPTASSYLRSYPVPADSTMFIPCTRGRASNGLGYRSPDWNHDVRDMIDSFFDVSESERSQFLSSYDYEYVAVTSLCFQDRNESEERLAMLRNSSVLSPVGGNERRSALIFEVAS